MFSRCRFGARRGGGWRLDRRGVLFFWRRRREAHQNTMEFPCTLVSAKDDAPPADIEVGAHVDIAAGEKGLEGK